MTAIFALNLICMILVVCWPSKTWDARGMILAHTTPDADDAGGV